MEESKNCPCGSGKEFETCCGPVVEGTRRAETAEELMRSRYTAYAVGKLDHIERTNAEEIRVDFNRAEAERMSKECAFQNLNIRETSEDGNAATVEFSIRFRHDGSDKVQRERASFRRENGEWFYVDSEMNPKQTPVRLGEKIRRNDPCPCGSGKKYKKCCGFNAGAPQD